MEVTTKIKLKPYLREFLIAKFGEEPIRFPGNSDLLALIHVLRIKPPKRDIVQDDVNTEIVIPYQRLGRDPRTYNYLGKRAQMEFQKRVHTLFCITLNDYVAHKVHVEQFEWQGVCRGIPHRVDHDRRVKAKELSGSEREAV